MKNISITITIEDVCKKLGICYTSPNHIKVQEVERDAQKLADIYLELKTIIGELAEIEEKHEITGGLGKLLIKNIEELNTIDHNIVRMACKIARRKK
jgi:hypothetical protein